VARITECVDIAGSGRFVLRCRTGERIRVWEWLPDDPYPRAIVQAWPDEPGEAVSAAQLEELGDRAIALFERLATAKDLPLPDREDVLGANNGIVDPGEWLYALASRIPIGPADRYAVLAAPTAAERLAAMTDALDSVAAVIEFHLSE
jgi:hypothetical protein